jgi:hypothetical protein
MLVAPRKHSALGKTSFGIYNWLLGISGRLDIALIGALRRLSFNLPLTSCLID